MLGWTGKDGSRFPTLGTIIKSIYGSSIIFTSLGSKTLNTSSLGMGGGGGGRWTEIQDLVVCAT